MSSARKQTITPKHNCHCHNDKNCCLCWNTIFFRATKSRVDVCFWFYTRINFYIHTLIDCCWHCFVIIYLVLSQMFMFIRCSLLTISFFSLKSILDKSIFSCFIVPRSNWYRLYFNSKCTALCLMSRLFAMNLLHRLRMWHWYWLCCRIRYVAIKSCQLIISNFVKFKSNLNQFRSSKSKKIQLQSMLVKREKVWTMWRV